MPEERVSERIRVLIVDADAGRRAALVASLAQVSGVQLVAEAGDGDSALAQAEEHAPDVVLIDPAMPEQAAFSGPAIIRRITQEIPCVAVLALSGDPAGDDVYPAIQAGALGSLSRSTATDLLVAALQAAFRGQVALRTGTAGCLLHELAHPAAGLPPTRDPLTARELEVVRMSAVGRDPAEIATGLRISEVALRKDLANILSKLHFADRTGAALYAQSEHVSPAD
jgi:DNA-binding NarL/FixJ family response regulator